MNEPSKQAGSKQLIMMINVKRINTTAVKGTMIEECDEVELGSDGVYDNRRFYFIDSQGKMVNGKRTGELTRVRSEYMRESNELKLLLPGGEEVVADARNSGETVTTDFYGRAVQGQVVRGPWADRVSALIGHPLTLVRAVDGVTATDVHPVTLISTATMRYLRDQSSGPEGRWKDRFRMLFELDGLDKFEEDALIGHQIGIGSAVVEIVGPIPRCVVTKRNPSTGVPDFDTLGALRKARGENMVKLDTPTAHLPDGGKLLLGVYAVVKSFGSVKKGSAVDVL